MKKLVRLNINPAKLLKDEELKELHGGWEGSCALYKGGNYLGLFNIWCDDSWYTWQCDEHCAEHFQVDYCICNFGY